MLFRQPGAPLYTQKSDHHPVRCLYISSFWMRNSGIISYHRSLYANQGGGMPWVLQRVNLRSCMGWTKA